MHFSRHLAFWTRRLGDMPAITCDSETLSWTQLDRASGALAAHLAGLGVKPGDRVGCLLGNGLPWCVAFAASLRLGSIFVPLNAMFGRFELQQIAADAGCAAILSTPTLIAKLDADDAPASASDEVQIYDRRRATFASRYADIVAGSQTFETSAHSDDEVMIICYTSGTTGVPKGVALTHRNVDAAIQGVMLNYALRAGEERLLILAPLAFTGGVISNLAVLYAVGGSAWLEKTVDPTRAGRLLREQRITFFGGVPALWERIAQAPDFANADLSHLRTAYTGGAPVPRPLMDAFRAKGVTIRQQYGFSEACGGVSSPSAAEAAADPTSCGRALPAMDLELRDDAGQPVASGEVGEIWARGTQLMRGYWNNAEATREAFAGEWYKTGDLARHNDDGGLVIVDRKKNMLISGGVNIYPAEVERALMQIPGVVECVVFGVASERWGQEVAAIVYGPTLSDAAALLDPARTLLGPCKAPKQLRLSPQQLPKTGSGKITRTGLDALMATLLS